MNKGYYTRDELEEIGFSKFGDNVFISRKSSIYDAKNISIGSNVRIDDFCLLVGNIQIGNYIHIAAYTSLHASMGKIVLEDFSTLSSRVAVYAASDDYSGKYLTNSVIPDQYKKTQYGNIIIEKHVIVGTGSTILHNALLSEGVAVGAMSLVNDKLDPWHIYVGIPCKKLKRRSRVALDLEKKFLLNIRKEIER